MAFCLQGNLLLGQPSRSESSPHREPSPANPTAHTHLYKTSDARPRYIHSAYLWQVCVLSLQGLYGSHTYKQSSSLRIQKSLRLMTAGQSKEKNTCLPGFQGFIQTEAIRLSAFMARWTGQAVESRVCVYAQCNTHSLHFTLKRWRLRDYPCSAYQT